MEMPTKIYTRRWIILFVYFIMATASSFQWMEFAIIANIIQKYYSVSASAVNWTSMIYMITFPIFSVVGSYVIESKGLRVGGIIAATGTFLGAAVKILALNPDLFYVFLIGQTIAAISQVFFLSMPSKLAAVWFKPSEIALAVMIACNGTQFGFALGFVVPTTLVKNHDGVESIGADLSSLFWGQAVLMLLMALAVIFFFRCQPALPPTLTQGTMRDKTPTTLKSFVKSYLKLLKSKDFLFLFISYGINVGGFLCVGTFLNQFILYYFPNCEEDAGRMGLFMIIMGMIGATLFGMILDKSHKYKEITLFIYYFTLISVIAFLGAMNLNHKVLTYITVGAVGIFTSSYIGIGFELGVEVTFPTDEGATTTLLNTSALTMGVVFTMLLEQLYQYFGPFWALIGLSGWLVIGTILTHLVPNIKKRQDALRREKEQEEKIILKLNEF